MTTGTLSTQQMLDTVYEGIHIRIKGDTSSDATIHAAVAEALQEEGWSYDEELVRQLSSLFLRRLLGVNDKLLGSR